MISINANPNIDVEKTMRILTEIRADKMGGWFDFPQKIDTKRLTRIIAAAQKIWSDSEYLVCIGIGGSYLGHRAVIQALKPKPQVRSSRKFRKCGRSTPQAMPPLRRPSPF